MINYAKPIVAELRVNMVRVDADYSATPFKAKISNAERGGSFPPPHVVGYGWSPAYAWLRRGSVGGRDLEGGAVRVRLHHGGPQGASVPRHF